MHWRPTGLRAAAPEGQRARLARSVHAPRTGRALTLPRGAVRRMRAPGRTSGRAIAHRRSGRQAAAPRRRLRGDSALLARRENGQGGRRRSGLQPSQARLAAVVAAARVRRAAARTAGACPRREVPSPTPRRRREEPGSLRRARRHNPAALTCRSLPRRAAPTPRFVLRASPQAADRASRTQQAVRSASAAPKQVENHQQPA